MRCSARASRVCSGGKAHAGNRWRPGVRARMIAPPPASPRIVVASWPRDGRFAAHRKIVATTTNWERRSARTASSNRLEPDDAGRSCMRESLDGLSQSTLVERTAPLTSESSRLMFAARWRHVVFDTVRPSQSYDWHAQFTGMLNSRACSIHGHAPRRVFAVADAWGGLSCRFAPFA